MTTNKLPDIVAGMNPISLEEMDHVKLMHRRDTKYVIPAAKLPGMLDEVNRHYKVLEIDGKRIHGYQTLYFDTPEYEMYTNHHNGKLNRYKIRVRKYLESDISFLEIKFKNNRRETIKRRIRPGQKDVLGDSESIQFLADNSPYSADDITPALMNCFKRITLVHKTIQERITLDLDVKFFDTEGNLNMELNELSIIEVKRDRLSMPSELTKLLIENKIPPSSFSKYCMGTALTNPGVKSNLFMADIRKLGIFEPAMQLRQN